MSEKYCEYAALFKVLSDPTRLEIADMLSCGELCACKILEHFHITQPTLSHHMKNLCDYGLVAGRKEGKWIYYSLQPERVSMLMDCLSAIAAPRPESTFAKGVCDCD